MVSRLTRLDSQGEIRVEDYLDDKLQTAADLQSLDSLLETVRHQQELLLKQLNEADDVFTQARNSHNEHERNLARNTTAFNKQQDEIDQRLQVITRSETSDEAVRKFEASMEKLRRLDVATGYVETLTEVERLKREALENIEKSPQSGLGPYSQLRFLTSALREAQPAAEGAAPHLVDYVETTTEGLFQEMKRTFGGAFEKTLEALDWPNKDLKITDKLMNTWTEQVDLLLDLQEPNIKAQYNESESSGKTLEPIVLLPLEVMVHPLLLRFKYHFYGNQPTARLDKPEYFLSHTLDLVNRFSDFLLAYLQPLLDERAQHASTKSGWIYADATSALITALLPMVRQKLIAVLPQVAEHPQLLSHLMHELMKFDTAIRDEWGYSLGPDLDWKGLTWEVLVAHGRFDRWLHVEKEFAFQRYQAIIESADSGEIDYEGVDPGLTKPTKAAIRVNDLLETITDRYRPLLSFSQKLRFLIDVQITIFDKFHERLHSGLEAYLTMTSTIGRTVQGASGRDAQTDLSGVAGLERLCRIFGSAEYLEKKMRDWSDDVFFLDLWVELQARARQGGHRDGNLGKPGTIAGGMAVSEIASRTSNTIGDASMIETGALFDETAAAYHALRTRSEGILISTISYSITSQLRRYSKQSTWASISPSSSTPTAIHQLTPSSELDTPLSSLDSSSKYLSTVLASAPLRRIARSVAHSTQQYLWDNILTRHSFSASGAAQFARDTAAFADTIDNAIGSAASGGRGGTRCDEAKKGMRKIREACSLLTLPATVDKSAVDGTHSGEGTSEDERYTLWAVEKRLFKDNESAREVLAEMGIDHLSGSEARAVLERRVEVGA